MKNNHKTNRTSKELHHQPSRLVSAAGTTMGESLAEHTADAVEALSTRFGEAQERFAEFCAGAKTRVVAGAKSTDAAIRANPYQSLAVAAGVGLLAGVLLTRRAK